MLRRSVFATMTLALVISVLAHGPSDAGPPDVKLKIQAGAVHPTNRSAPYEYTRYYPDVLRVRRGQTVTWEFLGFHTVTFSKSPRPSWYRPDEVPGTYAVNEPFGFGATDCGRVGMKPCVLKGSTRFLSSGAPRVRANEPFALRIDAPTGTYKYFCTVHPSMSGTIQVVGPGSPVPVQKQIDAQIASQVRADSNAADALFRADQTPVSTVDADGTRVWRGLLGDSTRDNHVSILAFMPADLQVAAGDKVRYVYRDHVVNEVHTVTFPSVITGGPTPPGPPGLGSFPFLPACDFDDRATGMKGVPGLWGVGPWPACPGNAEILHQPWMTQGHPAPENQVPTAATYHDSGLLAPKRAPTMRVLPDTGRTLPSSFEAEFPNPGSFTFECNLHVDLMTGSVTVS